MNVGLYRYKNNKPVGQFLNVIFLNKVQWPCEAWHIFHFEITVAIGRPSVFVSSTKKNTCIFGARNLESKWLSETSYINLKGLRGKVLETESVAELRRLNNMSL
jgi:hypothetical protein